MWSAPLTNYYSLKMSSRIENANRANSKTIENAHISFTISIISLISPLVGENTLKYDINLNHENTVKIANM